MRSCVTAQREFETSSDSAVLMSGHYTAAAKNQFDYVKFVSVSECYQSLTTHQHQKGHTVPKQVIMIATSIQVATV